MVGIFMLFRNVADEGICHITIWAMFNMADKETLLNCLFNSDGAGRNEVAH